jgi:hypothetical protein
MGHGLGALACDRLEMGMLARPARAGAPQPMNDQRLSRRGRGRRDPSSPSRQVVAPKLATRHLAEQPLRVRQRHQTMSATTAAFLRSGRLAAGDGCAANHFQPHLLLVAQLAPIADTGVGDSGICNGP